MSIDKQTRDLYSKRLNNAGDFRSIINNSLKALARNNPREVKRIINSAFIRGYEASQRHRLSDGQSDEKIKSLHFAQGIQVYCVQKHLDWFRQSTLLYEHRVQTFFYELSQQLNALEPKGMLVDEWKTKYVGQAKPEQNHKNKTIR